MAPAEKAYKNISFLTSPGARHIRILTEYEEPRQRFRAHGVKDTIVMFGSARVRPPDTALADVEAAKRELEGEPEDSTHRPYLERALVQAERNARISRFYDDSRNLAARLTEWGLKRKGGRRYYICSGGGPGIMEAANRGAADVPGGLSVGLGISLPFEEKNNVYVSEELSFEFHYFFMRKYWFAYLAKAMVVMPGGFGTMDELFEVLTLRQTGKMKKRLPMVLFGREYWDQVINLDAMVDWGVISERDLRLVHRTDSVDDAFDFLVRELEADDRVEER
jgi:uncharacterized protein (TIGR00730 family)